ncbi:MAG TPA: hypothetical protein VJN43_19465 [Bryobacteraceae bacterium]|nr:hypothetical protein [Bryobacteraceae bacterium]
MHKRRHPGIFATLILAEFAFLTLSCGPPSDDAMERAFRENGKDLEQLRKLITEDSSVGILIGVSATRTEPETEEAVRRGLAIARLDQYRGLLRKLHLRDVGSNGKYVAFRAYLSGFEDVGYLYTENVPQGVVQRPHSLDEPTYSTRILRDHSYLYHWQKVGEWSSDLPSIDKPGHRAR